MSRDHHHRVGPTFIPEASTRYRGKQCRVQKADPPGKITLWPSIGFLLHAVPFLATADRCQVWWGIGLGFFICLCIGSGMIGAFYTLKQDYYTRTDDVWEGAFSLLASVIISIMGAALLRVSKLQDKWRVKLAQALQAKPKPGDGAMAFLKQWAEKYAMFLLPFVTVLREGLEAVVFIGGVSLSSPASGFPLAVFCGLLAGIAVGYLMYRYVSWFRVWTCY